MNRSRVTPELTRSCTYAVVTRLNLFSHLAKLRHAEGPLRHDPATRRLVVTVHFVIPDGYAGNRRLNLLVVGRLPFGLDVDPVDAVLSKALYMTQYVKRLVFEHLEDRSVVRIRSVEHEEIRKSCRRHTEKGRRAIRPCVVDMQPLASANIKSGQVFGCGKSRGKN